MSRWLRVAKITDEQAEELLYKIRKNIKMFRDYGCKVDDAIEHDPELETVYDFVKRDYLDLLKNFNEIEDNKLKTDVIVTLIWLNDRFFSRS